LKAQGRGFTCKGCRPNVKAQRRCAEPRFDFTEEDGNIWPMYIHPGGNAYGFCPGKATWDVEAAQTFRLLVIAAETGMMLESGGLTDQPSWWIELLGWFLTAYDSAKFAGRVRSVLPDKPRQMAQKQT
jgi:hypothetical protein